MIFSKKCGLFLGCLIGCIIIGVIFSNQPKVSTEMRLDDGVVVVEKKEHIFKEQEIALINSLKELALVDTISVLLDYSDETNGTIRATVLIGDADIVNKKDDIVSNVTDIVCRTDSDVQEVVILDAKGNQMN